ncbi:MAG: YlxR family protein [Clostridiales bacterium]|nr:YlxR family protein [Clostridiales bacterium]
MGRNTPLRTCVGCRESKPKKEMIRIVKTPEGKVMLDKTGRANGRGAYLCNNVECLDAAFRHRGLERSLKMPVDAELYESLKKEMRTFEE